MARTAVFSLVVTFVSAWLLPASSNVRSDVGAVAANGSTMNLATH